MQRGWAVHNQLASGERRWEGTNKDRDTEITAPEMKGPAKVGSGEGREVDGKVGR